MEHHVLRKRTSKLSMEKLKPIRKASIDDLNAIHRLAGMLGYSPSRENVERALKAMLLNPDYEIVVITENDESVVGFLTLATRYRLEDVSYLEVAAIVTDENRRGQGLGKQLMQYAEERAREKNFSLIGLRSSIRRSDAHKFYEHLGYEKVKQSFVFHKLL